MKLGLVFPFDSLRWVVPSNAPVLSSPPVLPQLEYVRHFRLQPPLGLTRRLASRLAHFPGAILYSQFVVLRPGPHVTAVVTFGIDNTICVQVQRHPVALKLFLDLVACVEGLLAEATMRVERFGVAKDGSLVPLTQPIDLQLTPDWSSHDCPLPQI